MILLVEDATAPGSPRHRDDPDPAPTAHAVSHHRAKSREAGCEGFDTKPVDLSRSLGKIKACLEAPRAFSSWTRKSTRQSVED
jgi:hypothetical protein